MSFPKRRDAGIVRPFDQSEQVRLLQVERLDACIRSRNQIWWQRREPL
jgi:hypothetical protein